MPKCDQLQFGVDDIGRLTVQFLDVQEGVSIDPYVVSHLKGDNFQRIQGDWERRVYGGVISQFKSLGVSHINVIDTARI